MKSVTITSLTASRHNWVEICRTMPLADMKERRRLMAEALEVAPDQIELIKNRR